jgi:hypothetical protein
MISREHARFVSSADLSHLTLDYFLLSTISTCRKKSNRNLPIFFSTAQANQIIMNLLIIGRHVSCQIECKDDQPGATLNCLSNDMNADGVTSSDDSQQQSLMRSHSSHVKVTLILSSNYSS